MTLPNTPDPSGQAVPAPPEGKDSGGGGGPLGGLIQWLKDSYNGLYKIVLEPSMPTRYSVALLVVGLLIGLIWGYAISPTTFSGANPNRLSDGAQEQWVKMVAVSVDQRLSYDPATAADLLNRVPNPDQIIERLLNNPDVPQHEKDALVNLRNSTAGQAAEPAQAINPPGFFMQLFTGWLLPFLLVVIIFPILVLLWRLLIYPNIVAGAMDQFRQMTDSEYAEQKAREKADRERMREEKVARDQLAKESAAAAAELGPPVMTQLSIYSPGRAYDESYEIELESGEFLGQCGAVISEAVDPDPVAIEVWLFDMFSSKNIAKVFITPEGNNDPSIRSRIEGSVDNPTTDIIVASPGTDLVIESDKLRLQAKMASVDFNARGRFENFRLQMLAWQKGAAPAGAGVGAATTPPPPPPAGAPPMSAYDDITFDPPPTPPGSGQVPPGGGAQPLQPPPLNIPPPPGYDDDDDDDPFGGTGDFTPPRGN